MKKYKSVDLTLTFAIVILVFLGVMMVFSSSYYYAMAVWDDKFLFLKKELFWVFLGTISLFITMNLDYHIWRKFAWPLFIASIFLLLLLFTPLGMEIKGARRWLDIGPTTLMPSEFAKFAIIIFVPDLLVKRRRFLHLFKEGMLPFLGLIALYAGLIILQPNLSTAITVSLLIVSLIFVAGVSKSHLLGVGAIGICASILAIFTSDYRMRRFTTFLDPFKDVQGDGYQVVQSLYALGTGGSYGVGLGQSILNKLYIPEPQNDFIFATIGEELGFVGSVFIMLVFLTLIYRGIKIAINAPDLYGMLVATGITALVSIQVMINIAVATSSMPVTGLPLPFISYGGNFLFLLLTLMGILLNISKHTIDRKDHKKDTIE